MILSFTTFSPGGNNTVIVHSYVPAKLRPQIAQKIMSAPYLNAEQVGYLSHPQCQGVDGRLDMMGGEFCINGLRSAAALLAHKKGKRVLRLQSSGSDQVMECECELGSNGYEISLRFTLPISLQEIATKTTLVHMGGISHILLEYRMNDRVNPMQVFTEIQQRYRAVLDPLDAFGVIPFTRVHGGYSISPVVFVRETNTIIPETGCGSGSIALASALFRKTGTRNFAVHQPSGSWYRVTILGKGSECVAILGGTVRMLVSGQAFL